MADEFLVIGSINIDLVAGVESFPAPGETVAGTAFTTSSGGKGANQAVALARLGGTVRMVGMVGDDIYGDQYLETFIREGVDASLVRRAGDCSTGVAIIEVDRTGENRIVIVGGANQRVDAACIDAALSGLPSESICLLQLEIPMDSILHALTVLREREARIILDPAPVPASPVRTELYRLVDILTPNQHEARLLSGIDVTDRASAKAAGTFFLDRGVRAVIIKAGSQGAYLVEESRTELISTITIDAVDTTGAGDSFNAGLAFALGDGRSLREAVHFATAVGALACTGFGAQSSMPRLDKVLARLT